MNRDRFSQPVLGHSFMSGITASLTPLYFPNMTNSLHRSNATADLNTGSHLPVMDNLTLIVSWSTYFQTFPLFTKYNAINELTSIVYITTSLILPLYSLVFSSTLWQQTTPGSALYYTANLDSISAQQHGFSSENFQDCHNYDSLIIIIIIASAPLHHNRMKPFYSLSLLFLRDMYIAIPSFPNMFIKHHVHNLYGTCPSDIPGSRAIPYPLLVLTIKGGIVSVILGNRNLRLGTRHYEHPQMTDDSQSSMASFYSMLQSSILRVPRP